MMQETTCVNCGYAPMDNLEEANVCILCGGTLCEHCYDDSSYCKACEHGEKPEQETPPYSGVCAECERNSTRLSDNGYCEGCVMQADIDAQDTRAW